MASSFITSWLKARAQMQKNGFIEKILHFRSISNCFVRVLEDHKDLGYRERNEFRIYYY